MNPKTKKILFILLIIVLVYLIIGYLFAAYFFWDFANAEEDSHIISITFLGPLRFPQTILVWPYAIVELITQPWLK